MEQLPSLQQGAGNLEVKSEESDLPQESEVSQASRGTESSQEETEHLGPWSRIFDEAEKRLREHKRGMRE